MADHSGSCFFLSDPCSEITKKVEITLKSSSMLDILPPPFDEQP